MLECHVLLILLQVVPAAPANLVYTFLLSLIALLMAIVAFGLRAGYNDLRTWRLGVDQMLRDHETDINLLKQGKQGRRRKG